MRSDAIPIKLVRSHALLTSEQLSTLFGEGYQLRGTECVEVVQRGIVKALADLRLGDISNLFLDSADYSHTTIRVAVKLRGPKGEIVAPSIQPIPTLLVLPTGLLGSWSLSEGQVTTVSMGSVAIRAVVSQGDAACVCVDGAFPFAGGLDADATASWLPNVEWPSLKDAATVPIEQPTAIRKLITENDVRRARTLRQRIRVGAGQIITPAARELADDLGLLDIQ